MDQNDNISIFENGTGILFELCESFKSDEKVLYYTNNTIDGWTNINSWSESISLYSIYKGVIEYLTKELPDTRIYWVIPSFFIINDDDDFKDEISYKNSIGYKRYMKLFDVQKNVCSEYNIPVLNISENGGDNWDYWRDFYQRNTMHPLETGYYKWAEILRDILMRVKNV